MKIQKITKVTDEIVTAFETLIPQLSTSCPIPNKNDIETIINSKETVVLIAVDEKILGTLTLVFNRIPTGTKVWIEDVVVDKNARGRGVAKELTIFAINYVKQMGINKINLTSSPERVAANKLYQKLGFKKRTTNTYRLTMND